MNCTTGTGAKTINDVRSGRALRWPLLLALTALVAAGVPLHAQVYDLVGVTLEDGGTVTGQFTIAGTGASGANDIDYINVDITVTGAGSESGNSFTVTSGDPVNPAGEFFEDPGSGPRSFDIQWSGAGITDVPPSDLGIVPGSIVIFADGTHVYIGPFGQAEEVGATPEPSTVSTLALGLLGLAGAAHRSRYFASAQS